MSSFHNSYTTRAARCLKSLASRLFVQQLVQADKKENIDIDVDPLWGESGGDQRIPQQKPNNTESVFMSCRPIMYIQWNMSITTT